MKLRGRGTGSAVAAEREPATGPQGKPGGKGRPTPSRQAARVARATAGTPATGSSRQQRREQIAANRAALRSTDPAKLPPAERVPERCYARDLVDGRRNLGPLLLVVALVYFVTGLIPVRAILLPLFAVVLSATAVIAVDCVVLARLVQREVAARYPETTLPVRWYAVRRALLPRRWRVPVTRLGR